MTRFSDTLLIGAHTSAQGGAYNALLIGMEIGATCVQLFTANQKRWQGKGISDEEAALFQETMMKTGMQKVMSHDSYLINLGSPDPLTRRKSLTAFEEELKRCHQLELSFLNFHPGAALDSAPEECLDHIVENILSLEKLAEKGPTRLLIETTAGQGSCVGWQFDQLGYLVERLEKKIPIGVCIDTCHIFAAGYDISTYDGWEKTLAEFDRKVGLKHLHAMHLNDSLKPLASRKDRHAPLGKGEIGIECFKAIMTHPSLQKIPKYLETPDGPSLWKQEIALLREFAS